jgi:hypothetical protein
MQFSDEAHFHAGGYADKQNVNHWVFENTDTVPYIFSKSQFGVHLPVLDYSEKCL